MHEEGGKVVVRNLRRLSLANAGRCFVEGDAASSARSTAAPTPPLDYGSRPSTSLTPGSAKGAAAAALGAAPLAVRRHATGPDAPAVPAGSSLLGSPQRMPRRRATIHETGGRKGSLDQPRRCLPAAPPGLPAATPEAAEAAAVDAAAARTDAAIAARAAQLAKQYRMESREIAGILRAFELVLGGREKARVGVDDFERVMRHIFHVPDVDLAIVHTAYLASCTNDGIDVEKFLTWYVQNLFTTVNTLKTAPEQAANNRLIVELAQKHQCRVTTMDYTKRQFDRFDKDGSGGIDYHEFSDMMEILFKVRNPGDVCERRLRKFWCEANVAGNGSIGFEEFANMYFKYFNPESEIDQVELLYASYNPCIQRQTTLRRGGM